MNFIDFFAGIGGFTAGLTQAGMSCAGYCEADKFALKSYRAIHNPSKKEWFSNDITKTNADKIPRADGWAAGFPCQDISICGNQQGISGARSGLFFEFVRLLKETRPENRPQWLLIENVKNLLSINGGRDFTEILCQISALGYGCEWQVINSKSYVPQNRERVFIVGHFGNRAGRKVFPVGGENPQSPVKIAGKSQSGRVYSPNGISACITTRSDMQFIDLCKTPKMTEIARCIKSRYNAGITNRSETSGVLTNGKIRRLTPRECFRLQGFTDEMFDRAQAVNSDNQLYKQAGNGVTVPVIYEIGKRLAEIYGKSP